jgi:high-affinity iron transporter
MSFGAAVLMFREGLEAALIVAIMLGYLKKVGRLEHRFAVWSGALTAAVLAGAFTVVLDLLGNTFDYPAKGIYEGATSFLAVGMLTYMIFWMSRQARYIKGSLEHSMQASFAQGASWGLFGLAFLTVAREGVETALFLSASAFQTSGTATLFGALVGLLVAIAVAYAVYIAGARLNLRLFFKVAGFLLVIFAAAILRYGIHEFEEIGWLPPIIDQVWNTGGLIPAGSALGTVLQALIGYTSTPSLIQLIGYFGYLGVMLTILSIPTRKPVTPPAPPASAAAALPEAQEAGTTERAVAAKRAAG